MTLSEYKSTVELEQFVNQQLKDIEDDERFHYPCANVFSNAPLALIQTDLEAKHKMLSQIKKIIEKSPIKFA